MVAVIRQDVMALKKRFQIFISSTFADLRDERDEIANAIQAMGHIPAGMELFGSDADDSWTVIERTIDLSDYFVLVLAGRYGTLSEVGVSFTEREFDYASSKGIPILAFIHNKIEELPAGAVERSAKSLRLLKAFKSKIADRHQVTFWSDKSDLSINVVSSLAKTVELVPRPGWVRGDIENEVKSLRSDKIDLLQRVQRLENEVRVKNAQIDSQLNPDNRISAPMPAAAIPVTLTWKQWIYNAEVDIPSVAAWLYAFQMRVHSPYSFAFAAYLAAISSEAMRRTSLAYPAVDFNGSVCMSSALSQFSEVATLSTESLAEITTSALTSGLMITDDPRAEAFSEYWKQRPYGNTEANVFATINDTCWMNCARDYANLPVDMRPALRPHVISGWCDWAANKAVNGSRR